MSWIVIILIVLGVLGIIILIYSYIEANRVSVKDITYSSDRVIEPFCLLHISDLHLYHNMSQARISVFLKRLREIQENKNIHILCITGDMIDNNSGIDLLPGILKELHQIPVKIAVLGNHDIFEYNALHIFSFFFQLIDRKDADTQKLIETYQKYGVSVLKDQSLELNVHQNKLEIFGMNPVHQMKKSKYLINIPENENNIKIILSHYPEIIHKLKGNIDMVLSGHTHGGQITFFGIPLTSKSEMKRRESKGLQIIKNQLISISNGMGTSRYFPLRFFAPAEITLIEIKKI